MIFLIKFTQKEYFLSKTGKVNSTMNISTLENQLIRKKTQDLSHDDEPLLTDILIEETIN